MGIVYALNSYTEFSPSGTGLHVITQATIPQGRRKDQLEMYSTGRYFTLTGNYLLGPSQWILPRQQEQEALYRSLEPPKGIALVPGASPRMLPMREDAEVIKKALEARNGEKFLRLWQGDISNHRSKSEAKFDLLIRLLYWVNDDVEQAKRLYKQSALYDEKDESSRGAMSYLDYTVNAAVRKRRRR
jgi:primase-polymerase (primpol)-like protein